MSKTEATLMSIRMENPATKFYHALNNAIKLIYNRRTFVAKFNEQLPDKPEDQMAEIIFELYEGLKKKKNALEDGIIEVFRDQGIEELFKEVLTLKTMRSALKSFAEDDLVGMIPEPFAFKRLHQLGPRTQRMDVYETALQQRQLQRDLEDSQEQESGDNQDMLNQGMSVDESSFKKEPKIEIDFEKLMSQVEHSNINDDEAPQNMPPEEIDVEAPEALLKSQYIVDQKLKYMNEQIEMELKDLRSVMSKNGLSLEDLGDAQNLPDMKAMLRNEDEDVELQSPPKRDMTFSLF